MERELCGFSLGRNYEYSGDKNNTMRKRTEFSLKGLKHTEGNEVASLVCDNGSYYVGQWKDGKKHGFGIQLNQSKPQIFIGFWKNNKKENGCVLSNESLNCTREYEVPITEILENIKTTPHPTPFDDITRMYEYYKSNMEPEEVLPLPDYLNKYLNDKKDYSNFFGPRSRRTSCRGSAPCQESTYSNHESTDSTDEPDDNFYSFTKQAEEYKENETDADNENCRMEKWDKFINGFTYKDYCSDKRTERAKYYDLHPNKNTGCTKLSDIGFKLATQLCENKGNDEILNKLKQLKGGKTYKRKIRRRNITRLKFKKTNIYARRFGKN